MKSPSKSSLALALGLSLIAASGLVCVPVTFIFGQRAIAPFMDRFLKLRVDPRFSGGEIRSEFIDDLGDDTGAGTLSYPLHESWAGSGYLDIVSYAVYEPITDPAWSEPSAFWQIAVEFAAMADPLGYGSGFSHPAARIYIDMDGAESGLTEGVDPVGEMLSFESEHPWDIAVTFDGAHAEARLRSADGSIDRSIPMIPVPEQRKVYVRIPLDHPLLSRVLDGRTTWHYVMAGAYSPYASGTLAPVKAEAEAGSGGGAPSELCPRIYDIVLPYDERQAEVLSSYDEASWTKAVVRPLECVPRSKGMKAKPPSAILAAAKAEMEEEARSVKENARGDAEKRLRSADPRTRAIALFDLGRNDDTRSAFGALLSAAPEDPIVLAYSGSLRAMEGGETKNPAKAVIIVQEAFASLDRAVAAAEGMSPGPEAQEALLTALISRASVRSSVPEEIFGANSGAADDYLKAAEMAAEAGKEGFSAELLLDAALATERAGKTQDARLLFLRRLSMGELGARVRYELLKRGLLREGAPIDSD
jgi:hypothetical protein